MIITLNNNNCFQVRQFSDTKEWFLEFKNVQQVDQLIEDLRELKSKYLKRRQEEYDRKHQLELNF